MGTQMTKEAYKKLIDEDVQYLNERLCVEDYSAELDHIKLVLFKSIDWLYPPKEVKKCPKCGSHKIVMFDSDNDLCNDCGYWDAAGSFPKEII